MRIILKVETIQISCDDFLPLPEHYRECEDSSASCVSTLGRYDRAVVETKECGEKEEGRAEVCRTRVLGGGARVTVCHCRENFCNKYSVQDTLPPRSWWRDAWDLLNVNM